MGYSLDCTGDVNYYKNVERYAVLTARRVVIRQNNRLERDVQGSDAHEKYE